MKKCTLLLALAFAGMPITAQQEWWPTTDGDTIEDDDNHASANLGQVKNMVAHAAGHFEAENIAVPVEITALLEMWRDENNLVDNFALVNQGQLKNLGQRIPLMMKTRQRLIWVN